MMKVQSNTYKVIMTALMMGLIIVSILFLRIPIPLTQGYVHLGDGFIFLGVLILGWKYGAVAAGFGSFLGDVIGGFAMWAPWSLGIKAIMAILLGVTIAILTRGDKVSSKRMITAEIIGMFISGAFMTAAYYFAEGIMYGNWIVPVLGIPWNIGQFAVGMALALLLVAALCKTPARAYFTYGVKKC